jgi:putative oxidoreductase
MEWAALIRLTIGLVFAIAAVAKWARPGAAVSAVRGYGLLPERLVRPVALVLPAAESVLAVALLGGLAPRAALVGAAVLLTFFGGLVAWTTARGRQVNCGCLGSVVDLRLGRLSIAMNLVLAGGAVAAATQPALSAGADAWLVLYLSGALLAVLYWLATYARSVTVALNESIRPKAVQ